MSMFKISIRTPQFHCVIDIPKSHVVWEFVSFSITNPSDLSADTIKSLNRLHDAMKNGGAIDYHKPTLTLTNTEPTKAIHLQDFNWTVGTTKGDGTIHGPVTDIATTVDYVCVGTTT